MGDHGGGGGAGGGNGQMAVFTLFFVNSERNFLEIA